MGKRTAEYPRRPRFFAHGYTRLLTKTCAAQEIGAEGVLLCITIAHVEDSKRYSGPVSFYAQQLIPLVGVSKWDTLDRARRKAVEAGWLHYESPPKGSREVGWYWVTIPAGMENLDTHFGDDAAEDFLKMTEAYSQGFEDATAGRPHRFNTKNRDCPDSVQYPNKGIEEETKRVLKGKRRGYRKGNETEAFIPTPNTTADASFFKASAALDEISEEAFRSPQWMLDWFNRHRAVLGLEPERIAEVFAMGFLATEPGRASTTPIQLFRANILNKRWGYLKQRHRLKAAKILEALTATARQSSDVTAQSDTKPGVTARRSSQPKEPRDGTIAPTPPAGAGRAPGNGGTQPPRSDADRPAPDGTADEG